MKDIAMELKVDYEVQYYQLIEKADCSCGSSATVIMSACICGDCDIAIIYCDKCNKFSKYICVDGKSPNEVPFIEYGTLRWDELIEQIKTGTFFI